MIKDFKFVMSYDKHEALIDFYWGLAVSLSGVITSIIMFMIEPASIRLLIKCIVASIMFGTVTMWTLINDSANDLDSKLNG